MRDRLSAETIFRLLMPTYGSGVKIMLAPAAMATEASPSVGHGVSGHVEQSGDGVMYSLRRVRAAL